MADLNNSLEGGTHGTGVTAGNSGGVSGDAFATIVAPANSAVTYDSAAAAHGGLGMRVSTTAASIATYAPWTTVTGTGRQMASFSFQMPTALPDVLTYIAMFRSASATAGSLGITPAGKLQMANNTGAAITATLFTTAMTFGGFYRIEFALTPLTSTTGVGEVNLYPLDSDTATESQTTSTSNFGTADIAAIRHGRPSASTWIGDLFFDDMKVRNIATGVIGVAVPVVSGSAPMVVGLTGAAVPVGIASGSAPVVVGLTGSPTPIATVTGSAPISVALTGAAVPVVTVTGTLSIAVGASADAIPVIAATGESGVVVGITGDAIPVTVGSGSLPVTVGMSAFADETAVTVTGALPIEVGLAADVAPPIATATGTLPVSVDLSAAAVPVGVSLGSVGVGIGSAGSAIPVAITAGALPVQVGLAGAAVPVVTVSGSLPIVVGLVGIVYHDPIDITVTGSLEPRRWSGSLTARNLTGTIDARRWKGAL